MKKIIGVLTNIILGFFTCPCLLIFITDIQGIAKGSAYTIPEVERDIYAMFGWTVLSGCLIILICSEIAIFKLLFKKNLRMLCVDSDLIYIYIYNTALRCMELVLCSIL